VIRALLITVLLLTVPVTARADGNAVYDRVMKTNTIRCGYYVWAPYLSKDPNTKQLGGIGYDLMEEVGKQLSLKIEWVAEVNLDSMFEGYRNGAYDMICAPITAMPARARVSDFTIPVMYGSLNLYARPEDKRFDHHFENANVPSVKYVSMEGELGAIIGREMFPLSQKIDIPQFGSGTDVLMNVATKKADVAAVEALTATSFMREHPERIRLVEGGPVRVIPANFSIPQGEERFKAMLNIAIQSLIDTGFVDRMIDKSSEYKMSFMPIARAYEVRTK
jgi:ABC-type amino acid transport substrate-binding protein